MLLPSSSSSSSKSKSKSKSNSGLKREECNRTHHDSAFSKWEVLIGSSDWEDYSVGKDGVGRYRMHNLRNCCSCPGLYELGVALIPNGEGRKSRKHDPKNIMVVYLGQTSNVRTRLQQYGRVGAHLDSGKLISSGSESECSGLFKQVFSRGYSIMFRWAPMIDKKKAEKTEAELLGIFDYAWNKCGNGSCRRDEILSKLDSMTTSQTSTVLRKLQLWKHPAFERKAGISIEASVPLDYGKVFLLPQVFKFGKSQLQVIHANNRLSKDHKICGVAIGNGSVCNNTPLLGRKRCEEHKGKKINGTGLKESTTACEDGSLCDELPSYDGTRREPHKGVDLEEGHDICGWVFVDGTLCSRKPVSGRKRCEEHKGRKTREFLPRMSIEGLDKKENSHVCGLVCGVSLGDGSRCVKTPVPGRKRCESHKGRRINC